jgi:predicted nuclease of predicted toxin-antitoxin system
VRLLFDECVEVGLAEILRALSHDVIFVQDIEPGTDDGRVVGLATAQDRLLVTVGKDFGELALRQRVPVAGVVLVRIASEKRHLVGPRVARALAKLGDRLVGSYTVIQETKIRIRPLRRRR